jgi:hypothetical protein
MTNARSNRVLTSLCRLVAFTIVATTSIAAKAGTLSLTDEPETSRWVTLQYTPDTGQLTATSRNFLMTTLEIISSRPLFAPERIPDGLILGPFDVATSRKFFILKTEGFSAANFGNVLPPRLTADELLADLQVSGSSNVDVLSFAKLYIVPEPTGVSGIMLVTPLILRLARGGGQSRRRSMQPLRPGNGPACGRCLTPLRAKAQNRRALSRTACPARVHAGEQAGPGRAPQNRVG